MCVGGSVWVVVGVWVCVCGSVCVVVCVVVAVCDTHLRCLETRAHGV